jgi:hypothetical protein
VRAPSWCWFAWLTEADGEADGTLAGAVASHRDGRPAGRLVAWPRGDRPHERAVRIDERLIDPAGAPAWVSLVLPQREHTLLFDDPTVCETLRAVLRDQAGTGLSTLIRNGLYLAGAVTVSHDGPEPLLDDPFARIYARQLLRVDAGLFTAAPAPPGPVIQRYGGTPWPVAGF